VSISPTSLTVGLLHPGRMGAAVAARARVAGASVLWCPVDRSDATAARAREAGLEPVAELGELVDRADVLLCLCPPAAAEEVATQVAAVGRGGGVYVEANAVAPQRVHRIAALLPTAWAVVDGVVVGSPPTNDRPAKLFLSGPGGPVGVVEGLFASTAVHARVLGEDLGQASALKLAYTGYQKASRVLAAVSYAVAAEHGVEETLLEVAAKRTGSYLTETAYFPETARRAWRWGPELLEAADLLRASGLPDDLMRAAAVVLERWEQFKDRDDVSLEQVVTALHNPASD